MSRSWSSAHDWKSCIPQKGIESSNLSISARTRKQYRCHGLKALCHNCLRVFYGQKSEDRADRCHRQADVTWTPDFPISWGNRCCIQHILQFSEKWIPAKNWWLILSVLHKTNTLQKAGKNFDLPGARFENGQMKKGTASFKGRKLWNPARQSNWQMQIGILSSVGKRCTNGVPGNWGKAMKKGTGALSANLQAADLPWIQVICGWCTNLKSLAPILKTGQFKKGTGILAEKSCKSQIDSCRFVMVNRTIAGRLFYSQGGRAPVGRTGGQAPLLCLG